MCGFVALARKPSKISIPSEILESMNNTLNHRGPDGEGYFYSQDNDLAFGHKRLSIIDLDNGHQPLSHPTNGLTIVFNGEIYNHKEIKKELEDLGHDFDSHCDTEVLLAAWSQWQKNCIDKLNGMFAFVVWDENKKSLTAVRDRLGIKPLFWHFDGRELQIASELKALISSVEKPIPLCTKAIQDYFSLGYVPEPKSIYQNYFKLPAGHYFEINTSALTMPEPKCYWDCLEYFQKPIMEHAFDIDKSKKLLIDSVNKRMVADVPVGSFLSGGLDSSVISAVMSNTGAVKSYAMGFDVSNYDETKEAEENSEEIGTQHKSITISYNSFEYLDELIAMFDEPFADNSTIPTYIVSKMASKDVKVVLSGDGADELFLGYRNYRLLKLENKLKRLLPKSLSKVIFGALANYYPNLPWAPKFFRAKSTFNALKNDSMTNFHQAMSINSTEITEQLFTKDFKAKCNGYNSSNIFHELAEHSELKDPIKKAQYIDFKTYLPSNILTKVDRTSMANSVEVRVPFLDHRLVQSVVGLNTSANIKSNRSKLMLRKLVAEFLPKSILYKKKKSFTSPMDEWFRMATVDNVKKLFDLDRLESSGIFNTAYIEKLIDDHQQGKHNLGMTLWSIVVFSAFLKKMGYSKS